MTIRKELLKKPPPLNFVGQSMVSFVVFSLIFPLIQGNNITVTNEIGPITCNENEDCYVICLGCNGNNLDKYRINCPSNGNCIVDCIQCNDTIINCNGNSNTNCIINCMSNPDYPTNPDALWGCYDSLFIGGQAINISFNCYDSWTCGDSKFYCTNYSDIYINSDQDNVTKNSSCFIYCEQPFSCYDKTNFEGMNAINMSLMCIGDRSCDDIDFQCSIGGYNKSECSMICYGDYSCFDNDAQGNNAKYINFDCIGDYSCSDKNLYCAKDNRYSDCNINCIGEYSCEYSLIEGMYYRIYFFYWIYILSNDINKQPKR